MSLIIYDDNNWQKVDKILDHLMSLGGLDACFDSIDDKTFKQIQKQLYIILNEPIDPQD